MGNLIKEKSDRDVVENKMEVLLEKIYKGDKEAIEKLNKIKKRWLAIKLVIAFRYNSFDQINYLFTLFGLSSLI